MTEASSRTLLGFGLEAFASVARLLLLCLLVVAPWPYGMVTWSAQWWCVAIAYLSLLIAAVVAAVRHARLASPAVWALVGLVVLAMLQTVPLPDFLWKQTVGGAFEQQVDELAATLVVQDGTATRDATGTSADEAAAMFGSIEAPRTLSISPLQTHASLATFSSAVAVLIACSILFRPAGWAIALFATLAISALLHAFVGLLQAVSWDQWTVLEMPSGAYFGTFVSRNSAPQYYAAGIAATIGLLVWWRQQRYQGIQNRTYDIKYPAVNIIARLRRRLDSLLTDLDTVSLICLIAITFFILAVMTTASRGGNLACFAALGLTTLVSLRRGGSVTSTATVSIIIGVAVAMLLTILGLDARFGERMETISEEAYFLNNSRITIWQQILAAPRLWLWGSGLGTFHFAILPEMGFGNGVWFYHAESIPFELLAEFGCVGFALGTLTAVFILGRMIRKTSRKSREPAYSLFAAAFVFIAVGLQSLVDFSLILPGVFLPAAALIGVFLGHDAEGATRQASSSSESPRSLAKSTGGESHSERHRHRRSHGSRSRSRSRHLLGTWQSNGLVLGVLLLALAMGLPAMRGFIQAEHVSLAGEATAPESVVVRARMRQAEAETRLEQSPAWPDELSEEARQRLSKPELVSAAFRAEDTTDLAIVREVVMRERTVLQSLALSCVEMSKGVAACGLDWRASWGMLRSDVGLLPTAERDELYARLRLLTGFHPELQMRLGTSAILAGDREIGLGFWRIALANYPQRAIYASRALVDAGVSKEELRQAMPDRPFQLVQAAQGLIASNIDRYRQYGEELAAMIEVEELAARAEDIGQWRSVVWLAAVRQDAVLEEKALREVVRRSPMDHRSMGRLAELLAEQGNYHDALEMLRDAARRAPDGVSYADRISKMRARIED